MNVPLIAKQLVDAVRTLAATADIQAEEDLLTDRPEMLHVSISALDAVRLIDFIDEHRKPAPHNPDQLTLF